MGSRSVAPFAVAALAAALFLAPSPPRAAAVDLDCADFSDQATAQEYLLPGDPHFLDADGDGIACEDLPCPCGGKGSGHAAPTPVGPGRLGMADARQIARKVAREFSRSDDRLDTAAVGKCKRRAERKIDCLAVDRGESDTTRTACHLRISVQVRDGSPIGKVASSRCRTTSLLILTEAEALTAMTDTLSEITGGLVRIPATQRLSQDSFAGLGEWTRTGPAGGPQKCSALLTATRRSLSQVSVSIELPECRPRQSNVPAPSGGGGKGGPIY